MLNWQTTHMHELLLLCSVGLFLFLQQFFLVQALRYIDAGALSPMSYFTIVFAGVFGWLLWSDTPDIRTFIGVALVLFSGLLTVLTGRKQEAAEMRSAKSLAKLRPHHRFMDCGAMAYEVLLRRHELF
jgi:drug/metabolite transporter (DMT)-like permease